ncbi:LysR family transcriptional regulator [Frankia sp. AgB1.9]|nr:LysR family transcriptional regulator [Frankia sp. AgW1.1]MBL7547611.1 LysR family transcriptional regulator [Frankia sp. AgB1.9]
METAQLTYFVAVAEELHFGRAAQRLGIAQPPLSRAISRLERRLGVQLLERSTRRVSLTPPGEVFLRESRAALDALDAAVRRTQQAARPSRLVLAVRPAVGSGLLPAVLAGYAAHESTVPVEMIFTREPVTAIRDGRADVALVCDTDDLAGLQTAQVMTEAPVALLPTGHPLTHRSAVTMAELRRLDGFSASCPEAPLDEILDRVALGLTVVIAGETVADRAGNAVVPVPVADLPVTHLTLAWTEAVRTPALTILVREARRAAAREHHQLAAS